MPDDEPLPDYYAILQVNPAAEPEIIDAAYRRLMLKYHPDTVAPELRSDPDLLSKVRSINLAYDVLSDPGQRAAYDAEFLGSKPEPIQEIDPNIETRILLVACGNTKRKYSMLLGRKKTVPSLFRVLGFEPLDRSQYADDVGSQVPALPSPPRASSPFSRFLQKLGKTGSESRKATPPQPEFPSARSINEFFDEKSTLSFSEVDFGGWMCPDCNSAYTGADGVTYSWCRCSGCASIYCAGNIHNTKLGEFGYCPWCGRPQRITHHIRPGDQVDMPLKGVYDRPSGDKIPGLKLPRPKKRSLFEK